MSMLASPRTTADASADVDETADLPQIQGSSSRGQPKEPKVEVNHSRPLWKMPSNPFWYDKPYETRRDLARMKVTEDRENALAAEIGHTAVKTLSVVKPSTAPWSMTWGPASARGKATSRPQPAISEELRQNTFAPSAARTAPALSTVSRALGEMTTPPAKSAKDSLTAERVRNLMSQPLSARAGAACHRDLYGPIAKGELDWVSGYKGYRPGLSDGGFAVGLTFGRAKQATSELQQSLRVGRSTSDWMSAVPHGTV